MRLRHQLMLNLGIIACGLFLMYSVVFYTHVTSRSWGASLEQSDVAQARRLIRNGYVIQTIHNGQQYVRSIASKLYHRTEALQNADSKDSGIPVPQSYEMSEKDFLGKFREVPEDPDDVTPPADPETPSEGVGGHLSPAVAEYLEEIRDSIVAIRHLPWSNLTSDILDNSGNQDPDETAGALGPIDTDHIKPLFQLDRNPSDESDVRDVLENLVPGYHWNGTETVEKNDISPVDAQELLRELEGTKPEIDSEKELQAVNTQVAQEIPSSDLGSDPERQHNETLTTTNSQMLAQISPMEASRSVETHMDPEDEIKGSALPVPDQGRLWRLKKVLRLTLDDPERLARCSNLTKSSAWKVAMTDRWHTVEERLMYVYSAFLDERVQGYNVIRVVGMLEGWEAGIHLKPYCQIWLKESPEPFIVQAYYDWLPGQPIAKYKAVLMSCVYSHDELFQGSPVAVSLTTKPCTSPAFLVRVHTQAEASHARKVNMTLCLSGPMKFGYADVGQFVQWMEFNRKMGVDRFVLYNHSVDAALRPYLVYYAKKGFINLLPWVVPDSIPNPLVYLKNLGHLGLINDCLYRSMHVTNYIAYMDMDELIVPRAPEIGNWADMILAGDCTSKPQSLIKNVFFRREWPSDDHFSQNETVSRLGLISLLKTKRERKIWPPFMRSKYFIHPKAVEMSNVHSVFRFMNDKDGYSMNDTCVIEHKYALLQHYRYWGEVTGSYVVDTHMHKYADFLVSRVKSVHEHVLQHTVS